MIDAYEIGIQLLLQDDVTAGLAIIKRELAEVDRAIAATSASLGGLVSGGEKGGKTVAASRSTQPVEQTAASAPLSDAPLTAGKTEDVKQESASDLSRERPETVLSLPDKTVDPVVPISPVSDAVPTKREIDKQEVRSAPGAPTVAPLPSQPSETPPQIDDGASVSLVVSAPATPATPAVQVSAPAVGSQRDAARAVGQSRLLSSPKGSSRTGNQAAVTASIGRSFATSPPAVGQARRQDDDLHQLVIRDRTAAPWSGVTHGRSENDMMRVPERAAAPPPQTRERSEGGAGTVMLDGRLVGQWLSDHMAREASRPPGGTSFFDPRQMPAWNISGAL